METASRYGSKPETYVVSASNDVTVEVLLEGQGPRMGEDAELSVVVKNLSSEPRSAVLHSQVAVMYYTGVYKASVRKDDMLVELKPNEGEGQTPS